MKTKWRVVIIESERDWGMRVDSVELFDTYVAAAAFQKDFNKDNPPRVGGMAPDWYMQAEDPEMIEVKT